MVSVPRFQREARWHSAVCACQGRNVPALPSAPRSPYCGGSLRRVTGTTARRGTAGTSSGTANPRSHGHSRLVRRQLLSTSILPGQGH